MQNHVHRVRLLSHLLCLPFASARPVVVALFFSQTVGYWSIRGLAQAIRYVLAYAGVPFADTRYQQGSAPELSRAAWLDVKEKLQLDFPNLPCQRTHTHNDKSSGSARMPVRGNKRLIALCVCVCFSLLSPDYLEDELRLTQSTTILRHLGRKHGLSGGSLAEQARCDLVVDTTYDFKSVLVSTAYTRAPARAEALQDFADRTVPHYFAQFEALLARNQAQGWKWLAGDNLTIADFILFEMVDQTSLMLPGVLENGSYPLLRAFTQRFIELPPIAQYRKWTHFMARPLNNMAGFQ
jgi:glutathione S-transferase